MIYLILLSAKTGYRICKQNYSILVVEFSLKRNYILLYQSPTDFFDTLRIYIRLKLRAVYRTST